MGNKGSKASAADRAQVQAAVGDTTFTTEEVELILAHFRQLTGDSKSMTRAQFQEALGYSGGQNSLFADRVFSVAFATDGGDACDFAAFVAGLHRLSATEAFDSRLTMAFNVYRVSGNDYVSQADMERLLMAALRENGIPLAEEEVRAMVRRTFEEHGEDGRIDLAAFRTMVTQNPRLLRPLALDVREMIRAAQSADEEAA